MNKGQKTALVVLGAAAVTVGVVAVATRKTTGGGGTGAHKYNVNDILHNSDVNDNFVVMAIVVQSGVNIAYRLIRISDGTVSDITIAQVDNSTAWTLVPPTANKFQIGDVIYNPAVGIYPAYKITDIRAIQGLLRYVGMNIVTGGYWDFPVALVDATWQKVPASSTKFQIGQVIRYTPSGITYTILNIADLGGGLTYILWGTPQNGGGILVSVIDNDPNWVLVS